MLIGPPIASTTLYKVPWGARIREGRPVDPMLACHRGTGISVYLEIFSGIYTGKSGWRGHTECSCANIKLRDCIIFHFRQLYPLLSASDDWYGLAARSLQGHDFQQLYGGRPVCQPPWSCWKSSAGKLLTVHRCKPSNYLPKWSKQAPCRYYESSQLHVGSRPLCMTPPSRFAGVNLPENL